MGSRYEWVMATSAGPEVVDASTAEDYGIDELMREENLVLVLSSGGEAVGVEGSKAELLAFLASAKELVEDHEPAPAEDADEDDEDD